MDQIKNKQQGAIMIYLIAFIAVFVIVMVPVVINFTVKMKMLSSTITREQSLQIAEAGVNYYQWHLVMWPRNYQDQNVANPPALQPNSIQGPFEHDYLDKETNQVTGHFQLYITVPPLGATNVLVKSIGWTTADSSIKRTVTAEYKIPSVADYSFLSNPDIWLGTDEEVNGQMLSNSGIRFDGIANNLIKSAKTAYNPNIANSGYQCSSGQGSNCPAMKDGIWSTECAGLSQTNCNNYKNNSNKNLCSWNEVQNSCFPMSYDFWQMGTPGYTFNNVNVDLGNTKNLAQSGGIYKGASGAYGYSLVFNSNATVSIYKVTNLISNPQPYFRTDRVWYYNSNVDFCNYSAGSCSSSPNRTLIETDAMPANGVIFLEDNVWVEGMVNGQATVVAADTSSNPTLRNIYIPNNIVYNGGTGINATDVLGLIAQRDIAVTYHAPVNLTINAAMVAQNGGAQFYYYSGDSGSVKNGTINIFGSIMTYQGWTWTWVSGGTTNVGGYSNTSDSYDARLQYASPPQFPLDTSLGLNLKRWVSE
jgi:hypothetical protein